MHHRLRCAGLSNDSGSIAVEPPFKFSAALAQAILHASGVDVARATFDPVSGGSINMAYRVGVGDQSFFLKRNRADALPMFEAEADGLAALAAIGAFRIPRVLGCGATDDDAFLLLEHLDLRPLASDEDGLRFAEALAQLHHDTGAHYGWPRDNFIGRTPQINTESDGWARFFILHRLTPQLERARAKGYAGALGRDADALLERVPGLFVDYRPPPSLLHGDLWNGNAAIDDTGRPAIFDPAVYRGDRDADLAMSELFGGFPHSFYVAYRRAWPMAEGYEQRKTLYNLYHVLNHLNLFGRGYLGQAERMVRGLYQELRR
ncbi:fructosamine kinase family protein [Denitromonas ohlonensis]|uniref:Fructosamine kinase family protein n=2 Tax=Denitromonas TaxID=139331 RepID=A0A557SQL3_9RHOO|nr:fructosamine kinase family protein [Denitromonas ohlonensis]TVO79695.1 fructosamine kinase family protein [Denitromonas ohlonensis]